MKNAAPILVATILFSIAIPCGAQDEKPKYEQELGAQVRFCQLGGEAAEGESWGDVFDNSVGIGLQFTVLWRTSPSFEVGGYLGFSYDSFDGASSTVNGVRIEPDAMTMTRHTIGVAGRFTLGKIQIEPRLGIGMAIYLGNVDAKATTGSTSSDIAAIEASTEFTFEVGVRGSTLLSDRFALTVGVAYEQNGAPGVGFDLDDTISRFGDQENFVFDIGLKYVF